MLLLANIYISILYFTKCLPRSSHAELSASAYNNEVSSRHTLVNIIDDITDIADWRRQQFHSLSCLQRNSHTALLPASTYQIP